MEQALIGAVLACGAKNAAVIAMEEVSFEPSFREACAANYCGHYGKSWMCPPDVGEIDQLIARARLYRRALVYHTVGELEDSFDYENMQAAKRRHAALDQRVRGEFRRMGPAADFLQLGGHCSLCPRCAREDDLPCRHPQDAISELSAYGVNVTLLAQSAGIPYAAGPNTVTYFSAIFY